MLTIYQNTLSPSLTDTIEINGVPFNLTGSTVTFNMRPALSSTPVISASATVVSPTDGTVRYDWQAGDTATAGSYAFWWEVTLPSTDTQDSPESDLQIVAHGTSANALCTIQDVHMAMEISPTDTSLDEQIIEYINEASDTIIKDTRREFAPVSTATTRRFKVNPMGRAIFIPWDLQSVDSVILHPDEGMVTITDLDYSLEPFPNAEGVYTAMLISPWIPLISTRYLKFNYAYLDVTGTWGFPSVPEQVKRAAVITVRTWLRKDAQAAAGSIGGSYYSGQELPAQLPQTYAVPAAARRLLASYARTVGAV